MASAYLTKTVTASTATSYTVSFWVKINDVSNSNTPYFWSIGSSAGNGIYFDTDGKIDFFRQSDTSYLTLYDGVLRDPSAWYHIVWSVNSGTGTAYVNGVTGNSHSSIPALNDNTGTKINIHSYVTGAYNTLDCCMAHFHFIDGTAYPASTFGETDSTSGIWKPKTAPSVTYGTNGFFLKFENSGAMGTDSSGNSNTFTVNGTLTQNVDTPSNNFCTFNSVNPYSGTLSNGNLKMSQTNFNYNVQGTLGMESGKYYWEYKLGSTHGEFGICEQGKAGQSDPQGGTGFYMIYSNGSAGVVVYNNATGSSSTTNSGWTNFASGQIIGIAYDADNGKLYFHNNGTYYNSGDPAAGTGAVITGISPQYNGIMVPFCGHGSSSITANTEANFGSGFFGTTAVASANSDSAGIGSFEFSVPSGYYSLCTKNIKDYG
jgi:hypothetical protein